jgi:putative peptidoglycan lipid II flippase
VIRVVLTTILGYLFAFTLPKVLNIEASWGTAGLTASAGISGWIEFYLLRRALNLKIGTTGIHITGQIVLWSCGIVSGGIGFLVKYFTHLSPIFEALIVFSFFGVAYFIFTYILNVEESRTTISKIIRKVL